METLDSSAPERFDTIVIGAGQAGLATAYYLAQAGVDFILLDSGERIGESWRKRWDSLRLFTPAYMNNLPGHPFPTRARRYLPTKDEAADYLAEYAARFDFPLRLGVQVDRLARNGDRYVVTTGARRLEAQHVVVATGPYQRPRIPAFADSLSPSIRHLHSSAYKNPEQLGDGATIVVGAATSGAQIAMELAPGRRVYLSGRDVPAIPKKFLGLVPTDPVYLFISSRPGESRLGSKIRARARTAGAPLIGFNYRHVRRSGVERVARVVGARDGCVELEDGRTLEVENVVWSTGYRVDFSWIDLPIFGEDGYPSQVRGVVADCPGLYFIGLLFQHTLSSSTFLGVGRDAKYVVDDLIARRRLGAEGAVAVKRAS